jgi:hypothetical protein
MPSSVRSGSARVEKDQLFRGNEAGERRGRSRDILERVVSGLFEKSSDAERLKLRERLALSETARLYKFLMSRPKNPHGAFMRIAPISLLQSCNRSGSCPISFMSVSASFSLSW